jgi:sugar phosphate isomerase/epimerase
MVMDSKQRLTIQMKKLKAGLDNYCLLHKGLMPMEVVRWAYENGAEGVAFSGYDAETRESFTSSYLRDVKDMANDLGLYLEWGCGQHVPMDLETFKPKDIYISNRRAVGEACGLGAGIVRSCSGGLMRWKKESPSTATLLKNTAKELKKQAPIFRDNGVILAIETHFEFTTFELLQLFEMCETEPGDYLGICLDTMNLLTMLEEPVAAAERILPWVVTTHIKDGGIIYDDNGITTFTASCGDGVIDIERIIAMLASTGREINLSVEDHGGSFHLPVNENWFIERFPDLPVMEYNSLLELSDKTVLRMRDSLLRITERIEWPDLCEVRTRHNIEYIKALRDKIID